MSKDDLLRTAVPVGKKQTHDALDGCGGDWMFVDCDRRVLHSHKDGEFSTHSLSELSGFYALAREYLKSGWECQYYAAFTWLGMPMLQFPDDLLRVQEIIWRVRPDVIVETGVFMGGSLVYYASLCRLMGKGRVIGIDITIDDAVRKSVAAHPVGDLITMYEGNSISADVLERVRTEIKPSDTVLVILDSDHSKAHVASELDAYSGIVSEGSYIVVCDGIMRDLTRCAGGQTGWDTDNPFAAAKDFAERHPEFLWEEPAWAGKKTVLKGIVSRFLNAENMDARDCPYSTKSITHWPGAFLYKKKPGE